jgi:hypothetical protein
MRRKSFGKCYTALRSGGVFEFLRQPITIWKERPMKKKPPVIQFSNPKAAPRPNERHWPKGTI